MKVKNVMLFMLASFFLCTTAQALPVLQVDFPDGANDTSTETIVATGSSFSVYTLLDGDGRLTTDFYKAVPYNSQDNPAGLVTAGSGSFYSAEFLVDVSRLDPSIMIHFDLYGDGKFAPNSNDWQISMTMVPPPILLLGIGLIGLVGFRKRSNRNASHAHSYIS